jgi:DHA3 family macrolide efflux protein-like MFS transporter
MLIRSTGAAFQWPAMQASTSMMVTKENLPRVAGLNQSLQGLVSIVAPPLGAVLLEMFPIEYVIAVDVLTAIMAVGPLMFIAVPQPDRKDLSARGVLSDMREGFRWIWSKKALVHIMLISLSINMVTNPAFSLLPLLVTDYFNGGAIELAWIQSANGLGMILGGLALGVWGGFKSKSLTAFSAMTIAGVGILGFSQTPGTMLWLGIFFIFIFGFMNSVGNSSFMTVLQTIIPHEMQGRVFTLVMATSIAVAPLGLTIAGPVAEMLGVRSWFLVSGFVIVAGALFGLLSKEIRSLDRSFAESEES